MQGQKNTNRRVIVDRRVILDRRVIVERWAGMIIDCDNDKN